MAEAEVLQRIDAHMARGNQLMEQNTAAFQDLRTVIRETNLRHERFMRELSERQETVLGGVVTQLREQSTELRQHRRELREHRKQMREGHREFVEESRAQRAALFRILDRLDGGDAPAAA